MEDELWLEEECLEVQRLIDSFDAIKTSLQAVNSYVNKTDETISMSGRVLGHWAKSLHNSAAIANVLQNLKWNGLNSDLEARRMEELKQIELEEQRQKDEMEKQARQEAEKADMERKQAELAAIAAAAAATANNSSKRARGASPQKPVLKKARRQTVAVASRKRQSMYGPRPSRQRTQFSQYI